MIVILIIISINIVIIIIVIGTHILSLWVQLRSSSLMMNMVTIAPKLKSILQKGPS